MRLGYTLAFAGDSYGTRLTELNSELFKGRSASFGWSKGLAAALCLFGGMAADISVAQAQTRSLKLYFVHTREKAEIVYKRNGRFDPAGLKRINMFLRDWRRNEPTKMSPQLLDVVWEAYRQSGSRAYIHVVSGYRSPATNSMLRGRSRGVAKKSQHMLGKAMDFYLPDVQLKKLRYIGLKLQAGGVGYYPRSGSPFVHFDVGNVRHWPRMSRSELVSVFPGGKTLHVPSDGKPLPGYEQALAMYQTRVAKGDLAGAKGGNNVKSKKSGGLLAWLSGGGADEEEDNGELSAPEETAAPARAKPRKEVEPDIAIRSPDEANPAERQKQGSREAEITVLPPELAAPARPGRQPEPDEAPAEAAPEQGQTPEAIIAALPARDVPKPVFAQRAPVEPPVEAVALAPAQPEPSAAVAAAEAVASNEAEQDPSVPLPVRRPNQRPVPAEDTMTALADENVVRPSAPVGLRGSRPAKDNRQIEVASLPTAEAPRPRRAVAAAEQPPATVTTPKQGRVKLVWKEGPKPKVTSPEPEAAEWAADKTTVENQTGKQKRARPKKTDQASAEMIVRTAPSEVYSAGFEPSDEVKDPNRFTGKAVEFLSVSKFKK